jgi:uncharacterized membrane protein YhaH (DUF805 family)
MTLNQAIKTCLQNYATFSGRASRSEYWWWLLSVILLAVSVASFEMFFYGEESNFSLFSDLFYLSIFLPDTAVSARRLQDVGFNATPWLFAFFGFGLWNVAGMIATYSGIVADWYETGISDYMLYIEVAIFLACVVIFVFPSQSGTNTYGPNPHEVPS